MEQLDGNWKFIIKKNNFERISLIVLVAISFLLYISVASNLPMKLAPDEDMRNDVAYWIFEHRSFPIGNEWELINNSYGFSYATLPFLPAIVSAFFMQLCAQFTDSEAAIFFACRLTSVLSITATVYFSYKVGRLAFKTHWVALFFAALIAFWPEVVFVSGYFNNDALSLLSDFLILYFLLKGKADHWSTKSCIGLGISFSVNILTYYNAYGWCLVGVVFCIVSVLQDSKIQSKIKFILQKGALVGGVVFFLAGWFFIRNAYLHHGDFLGRSVAHEYAQYVESVRGNVYHALPPASQGLTVFEMLQNSDWHWVKSTIDSLIGIFGCMDVTMSSASYTFYKAFLLFGLVLFVFHLLWVLFKKVKEEKWLLYVCLFAVMIVTITLSIIYSYSSDYQPQGRYVFPILPAIMIFVVTGYVELSNFAAAHFPPIFCGSSIICIPAHTMQSMFSVFLALIWSTSFAFVYGMNFSGQMFLPGEIVALASSDSSELTIRFTANRTYSVVYFVVWTKGVGIDEQWILAEQDQDCWESCVNLSDYNSAGTYTVHVYAGNDASSLEFVSATQTSVSKAAHKNYLHVDVKNDICILQMDPIEEYEVVEFALWRPGDLEPRILSATYDETVLEWTAQIPSEYLAAIEGGSIQAYEVESIAGSRKLIGSL